jgi:Zn-dependent protease with chaperone function
MDFYTHQEDARRRSRSLIWRFILANLVVVAIASGVVIVIVEAYIRDSEGSQRFSPFRISQPGSAVRRIHWENYAPVLIPFNLFLLSTITLSAFLKFRDLSSSGGAVAQMLGGERVSSETTDPLERRFLNVIEEMAIASNMPVPEAYVLREQVGINAFASGPSPEHSAIAVTLGALERLNREELQGVVAHEFSHIMHADVRLNLRLAAYVYGLLVVMDMGNTLMEWGLNSNDDSAWWRPTKKNNRVGDLHIFMAGALLMAFGALGKVVSLILSAAVSREREYLADATAVELTRNPEGIVGALKKIGGYQHGSKVFKGAYKGLSHFFLADIGSVTFLGSMFSTHPPLAERIQRLDPAFSGTFPESTSIPLQTGLDVEGVVQLNAGNFVEAGERARGSEASRRVFEVPFLHKSWMPPFDLHSQIVDVGLAEGTVCALLLSSEEDIREYQEELLSVWMQPEDIARRARAFGQLSVNQKLSVILMALPTIQAGSETRRKAFQGAVKQLVEMDGRESLIEFLALVLISYAMLETDPSFSLRGSSRRDDLRTAGDDLSVVVSACARFAARDEAQSRALVAKAEELLKAPCAFMAPERCSASSFLSSIQQLRTLAPQARATMMEALEKLVLDDGVVSESDVAVMRLFSILLRVPLAPTFERGEVRLTAA